MIYIIDIREEKELLDKRIISNNTKNLLILSIPMRHLFANKEFITTLSNNNKIYILCKSGNRSNKVKNKYFSDNKNIKSLDKGLDSIDRFNNDIKIIKENDNFGLQQYMQIMFSVILFLIIFLIYNDIDKKYILLSILLIIFMIYYQIYINSCFLSKIIPLND